MANGSARILLVDDEQSIQTLLSYPLRKEGYHVTSALDGTEALQRFDEGRFDLVVLDLMLPRRDGVEVCRELRARSQVPIIMLTAKGSESDKVAGLEVGADDYITKPFSMREFRSRVKAALRRSRMAGDGGGRVDNGPIVHADLTIDFERRLVTLGGEEIKVTYVEFEILGALARSPGRVLTRETLLEHVWGD
ncbi:MAG: response regulator transcription factor, partial [Actinobacteria bacterium]|nr:response regulator transcription factor [Actinomycetota bacterium]